jgi:hypothetical protein
MEVVKGVHGVVGSMQWVEGSAFKERELREGVKREEWT